MKLVFILMTKRLEFFSKSDARYSLELECARSSDARACSNSNVLDHLMLELARYPNFLMLAHPYRFLVEVERTVRCSRTVWFFVMFDMFEVQFWAKM